MFAGSLDYTICSTDPDHYNRIYCNLITPMTAYTSIIVTSLTCNCDMVVLNEDDYVIIECISFDSKGKEVIDCRCRYRSSKRCKAFNRESGKAYLDKFLFNTVVIDLGDESPDNLAKADEFKKNIAFDELNGLFNFWLRWNFRIVDMSYNVKLITGFYNTDFPIQSKKGVDEKGKDIYYINAKSIGFTMSTPILYLTSNIGVQSYRTNLDNKLDNSQSYGLRGSKIVLRINNSFVSEAPVIVNNADFQTIIPSNDLSMLEFKLVDANMHELELLSPMYITIHCDAIKDEDLMTYLMFTNEVQKELQKIQESKAETEQQNT